MALISPALAGSMAEPVQIAIMESGGFDWKWLIGLIVPLAAAAAFHYLKRKK